jgi:hypothetical protein
MTEWGSRWRSLLFFPSSNFNVVRFLLFLFTELEMRNGREVVSAWMDGRLLDR